MGREGGALRSISELTVLYPSMLLISKSGTCATLCPVGFRLQQLFSSLFLILVVREQNFLLKARISKIILPLKELVDYHLWIIEADMNASYIYEFHHLRKGLCLKAISKTWKNIAGIAGAATLVARRLMQKMRKGNICVPVISNHWSCV